MNRTMFRQTVVLAWGAGVLMALGFRNLLDGWYLLGLSELGYGGSILAGLWWRRPRRHGPPPREQGTL
jgi:hypothetical protein